MKKVTLSVAALLIAMSSFAQKDTVEVSKYANKAKDIHANLYEIVNNSEDMLSMIKQDIDSGFIYSQYAEFYQDLLIEIIKLAASTEINGKDIDFQGHYGLNCENCDEID
tara:strand:- start:158 stop:487 length:330 start_codon:yes stop_codon:yes gene_type:complete